MQYTLSINQFACVRGGFDLDLADLAIFDFVSRYAHLREVSKIVEGSKVYYWISYQKIIDEMPILGLKTKDAVYRRMKKLIAEGILEEYPRNREVGKSYFAFGERHAELEFVDFPETKRGVGWKTEASDLKPKHRMENRRGTDEKPEGGTDEKSDNQNTNFDQKSVCVSLRAKTENRNDPNQGDKEAETSAFIDFWNAYPRHVGKTEAEKRFRGLGPPGQRAAAAALPAHVAHWQRSGTEKRYIPHPATWLGQRRFEDELPDPNETTSPPKRHEPNRKRPSEPTGSDPVRPRGFADLRV